MRLHKKLFNREREENRRAYFDIQTFSVHYPKSGAVLYSVVYVKVCLYIL
jgi:hypothetical protein